MNNQKMELIKDKKKRGEWVELKFMAEAAERDLPASKPVGDSENFARAVSETYRLKVIDVSGKIIISGMPRGPGAKIF